MSTGQASPEHPTSPSTGVQPSGGDFSTRNLSVEDGFAGAALSPLRKKFTAGQSIGPGPGPNEMAEAGIVTQRVRASKLEYKAVEEVWDEREKRYKISGAVETPKVTELDEYLFVVRSRTYIHTTQPMVYIDIKSEGLRDILRWLLRGVRAVRLGGDMPSVPRDLLFNLLFMLEGQVAQAPNAGVCSADAVQHLNILVEHIKTAYKETENRLQSLVSEGKITYDLLWAFFKPGERVYTLHPGTMTPMTFVFDHGIERKGLGTPYFQVDGHCYDFQGGDFGQAMTTACINRFPGAVPICKLGVFPLRYHPTEEDVKSQLRENGKNFIGMMSGRHCDYKGIAYFESEKGKIYRLLVGGRIMVDPGRFRQVNPNYPKLLDTDWLKCSGKTTSDLSEDDFLSFAPTLFGFSFKDKFWGEFAIDNISEIKWSKESFNQVVIPQTRKDTILTIADRYLATAGGKKDVQPDDFIFNKGGGRAILLTGPPGVGKTVTVEALAESKLRPLYTISTGQLSSDAANLEIQLREIFETATHWGAILLFDEADVYLARRSPENIERSRLVAAFLQALENFPGVLFLTTNQEQSFDPAVLSRIHLTFPYSDLTLDARRDIFRQFLAGAGISEIQFNSLAELKLNGRQIRNIVSIARDVAAEDRTLDYSHIKSALSFSSIDIPEPGFAAASRDLYD
ncbi:uncharacterized protein GIQ15_03662 [Arthroderma uncinatum]|uniref:uncharacterized protein n=1 Tax=Arthroderma uncinatum TaxID=74035 RepID=UPI00144A7C6F|nr:uncharacterized protein GIQ15_03662 [Arthroderma uncinatum]KAF3484338.1 hypothetical protein GIQ15_03662 [Arthroderma uncinatum]